MMNRMQLTRVWPLLGLVAWACAAERTPAEPLTIEVWHGTTPRVGHLGIAQADFNLLGHVNLPYSLVSSGGLALVANNVDATFGDVVVHRSFVQRREEKRVR